MIAGSPVYVDGQMPQFLTSTLLLRGGHRWVCAAADAQAILACLSGPQSDPHKMFVLRGVDGQTLTIPVREVVGVIGDDRTPIPAAPAAPLPAMRKDSALPGSPFLIVEDFLDKAEFDTVLAFALSQEAAYAAATVTDTAADYRKAQVLFDVSAIQQLFVPRIQAMIPMAFSLLDLQPVAVKTIECQLTAHGEGDYFKRHNDNGSQETAGRSMSYVYYFNRAPKGFAGGQLRMIETAIENGFYTGGITSKDIEPKCNSMIMFPSHCHHEVMPVQCPSGEFSDRRFTVNGWVVRSM